MFDQLYDQGGALATIEMANFNPFQFIDNWDGFQTSFWGTAMSEGGAKCSQPK